ncbi:Zinc transporter ZIP10 [Lamellibrachia satsuma]|nr:Zinc transporter ZIP10 [Lamellibrachia satsuma]
MASSKCVARSCCLLVVKCLTPRQILTAYHINVKKGITKPDFIHICPAIIYDIDQEACVASAVPSSTGVGWSANSSAASTNVTDAAALTRTFTEIPTKVWSYSLLAVAIISLAGLMCVAIIPVMQRCYFDEILHVLVALAVGTLTGDAMLHLMPHALLFGIVSKMTDSSMRHKAHVEGVWKGMTLLLGIYLFFIVERVVEIVSNRRKQKNKKTEGLYEIELGDTGNTRSEQKEDGADAELVVKRRRDEDRDSEHYNHHGDDDKDGQRHGHSHGVPDSVSSMAWMIIMGDGLHNFTDGLAIGAAFSSSLPGGFSTTVAVFCHELPHELGDFAVLLRAGMSVKQALFYNIVSSALCLLGAISGVLVGNLGGMNLWVFAFTAGIFVYLSLVDMVPELISGNRDRKHPVRHLLLQLTGSSIGIGIMLLIALYERNLKTLFGN